MTSPRAIARVRLEHEPRQAVEVLREVARVLRVVAHEARQHRHAEQVGRTGGDRRTPHDGQQAAVARVDAVARASATARRWGRRVRSARRRRRPKACACGSRRRPRSGLEGCAPTPASATRTGMSNRRGPRGGPIPESISSCGVLKAPPARMTSQLASTVPVATGACADARRRRTAGRRAGTRRRLRGRRRSAPASRARR